MKRTAKTLLAMSLLGLFSTTSNAEIAVIVDSSVSVDSVNMDQLQRLYLGKPAGIQSSTSLTPIDHEKGSALRQEFAQKVLDKNEGQLSSYWSRLMFSGKGQPPRQYEGDAAVIKEVTAAPGTVGYIDAGSVTDATKVLIRIP